MRILWIELDNHNLQHTLPALQERGIVIDVARTAEDGLAFAKSYDYDLVMLDADFGARPGLALISSLRRGRVATPLMALSRPTAVETKVAAFHAGADEYVVRPFNLDELCCRLHAVVRRARG